MKKLFYLLTTAVLLIGTFTTCNKDVSVTGVKLDETSLNLGVGETKMLTATVLPEKATNKTVVFTSSNSVVATVLPNGLVTGITKGEATIVVTTADGNFTANCKVIVGDVAVTGVTLNKTTLSLEVDDTETLTANVLPENATNKVVIWTTSDPLVVVVVNGFVTATGKGEATITATTFEGNYKATCAVIVGAKLPVLSTLPASNITLNQATLGGNITDPGFPVYSEKGICFSTTQNPTVNDSKIIVSGDGTGNYSGDATGLSENTTYYARAFATNSSGIAYGEQISFTTVDLSQCASVRFDARYIGREDFWLLQQMGVFTSADVLLVSHSFAEVGVSPYYVIPSGGDHVPKCFFKNSYGESWGTCLPHPFTYNFQVGRKYTVICEKSEGSELPKFSVTDDGPR